MAAKQHSFRATIGGRKVAGKGPEIQVVQPHRHEHVLGVIGSSTQADAKAAIKAAADAAPAWRAMPLDERAAVLLKAADLLAGPWRARLNAATMLGQGKTAWQAEIDAACELIDFWRFNAHFASRSSPSSRWPEPRRVEPVRPPPPGGLRLRRHAVQLHRDRRQPADRPRADGQHRALEARAQPDALRALPDGAAGGGRPAARRHQPAARPRHRDLRGRAAPPRPRRHPLHRLHADLPAPLVGGRQQHRVVPRLPAAGRRDRRQGLRRRPSLGRPRRAAGRR